MGRMFKSNVSTVVRIPKSFHQYTGKIWRLHPLKESIRDWRRGEKTISVFSCDSVLNYESWNFRFTKTSPKSIQTRGTALSNKAARIHRFRVMNTSVNGGRPSGAASGNKPHLFWSLQRRTSNSSASPRYSLPNMMVIKRSCSLAVSKYRIIWI